MPDGRRQEPGGWNRIVLYVENLDAVVSTLKQAAPAFETKLRLDQVVGRSRSRTLTEIQLSFTKRRRRRPR